jgi:hypothetical protein
MPPLLDVAIVMQLSSPQSGLLIAVWILMMRMGTLALRNQLRTHRTGVQTPRVANVRQDTGDLFIAEGQRHARHGARESQRTLLPVQNDTRQNLRVSDMMSVHPMQDSTQCAPKWPSPPANGANATST